MAEGSGTISMMKEGLICSICLDTYTDPKILPCHHVYCLKCVEKLVMKTKRQRSNVTCPICRRTARVPDRVANLQSDFRSNYFLEILDQLREEIAAKVSPLEGGTACCPTHQETELEFYCETCGVLVCCRCAVRGGQHYNHDYKGIREAFAVYKQEVATTMAPMEKNLMAVNSALTKLEDRHREILEQQTEIRDRIKNTANKLKASIDAKKCQLISQLDKATEKKLKDLSAQVDRVSIVQAQFCSILDSMKSSLQTKNYGEVLTRQKDQINGAKKHLLNFPLDTLRPVVEANMLFTSSSDVGTCVMHGQLFEIHATGEGLRTAEVGTDSLVNVDVMGDEDNLSELLQCELVSDATPSGTVVRGAVRYDGRGLHRVGYTPIAKGSHHLHVKVQGQHISGSPYRVSVVAGSGGEGEAASSQGDSLQGGGLRGVVGSGTFLGKLKISWPKSDESSV